MKKQIFEDYASAVAKQFHLTTQEMFTYSKRRDIIDARQMLYYLCEERQIRASYIQRFLEDYNYTVTHSTIIHGRNKAKELMAFDSDVRDMVNRILESNKS
jgi:chromosomal replication initiation ATPase DnaA